MFEKLRRRRAVGYSSFEREKKNIPEAGLAEDQKVTIRSPHELIKNVGIGSIGFGTVLYSTYATRMSGSMYVSVSKWHRIPYGIGSR